MEEHLQMEPARSSLLKQTCGHRPYGAEAGRRGTAPTAAPGQAPQARYAGAAPPCPLLLEMVPGSLTSRKGRGGPTPVRGQARRNLLVLLLRAGSGGTSWGEKGTQRQRRAPTSRCSAGTTLRCQNPSNGAGRRPSGDRHGYGRVPASPPAAGTAPGRGAVSSPFVPSSGGRQRLFLHRFTSIKTSRGIIYKRI